MRKFECKGCENHCVTTMKTVECSPSFCLYDTIKGNWYEVMDSAENAQTTNEQFGNSEQLPDWVKVGEPVYNIKQKQYQTISLINGTVICKDIDIEGCTQYEYGAFIIDCVKARKRPFNADEMKKLVGKILTHKQTGDLTLVTDFINEYDKDLDYHYSTVFAFGENYTDGDLMDDCTIDGKPCYVLEHLENGEWVE